MNRIKNIQTLVWFNSLLNVRFYSVVAILYFAQVTGSYALGISIFSIVLLSQAVFEVPTGYYSDKIGRRKTLILGAAISCLSVICYAIGQSYLMLAIGGMLQGLYSSLFSGNNDALLYESLAEVGQQKTYHEVLGRQHSYLELAGFVSAALGGLLAYRSYELLMWISLLPQLAALIVAFRIVEPSIVERHVGNIFNHLSAALSAFKKSSQLRFLSLANIIGFGIGEASWTFQSAFYKSVLPVWAIGLVMSLNYLASAVSFRLSGRIINRFKALNVLLFGEIYSRILSLVALVFPSMLSPFLLATASVTYGPTTISMNTLLQAEFTNEQRATMASLNSLAGSIFYAVFALIIGLIGDSMGPARALLFAQVCLLSLLPLYLKVFKTQKL